MRSWLIHLHTQKRQAAKLMIFFVGKKLFYCSMFLLFTALIIFFKPLCVCLFVIINTQFQFLEPWNWNKFKTFPLFSPSKLLCWESGREKKKTKQRFVLLSPQILPHRHQSTRIRLLEGPKNILPIQRESNVLAKMMPSSSTSILYVMEKKKKLFVPLFAFLYSPLNITVMILLQKCERKKKKFPFSRAWLSRSEFLSLF